MPLLDTDFCVSWLRGQPHVRQRLHEDGWDTMAISVITLAELFVGAYKSNRTADNLTRILEFRDKITVFSLTEPILLRFAEIKTHLERAGEPLEEFDILIASTALSHRMVLVTNNRKHYQRIDGLIIESWVRP